MGDAKEHGWDAGMSATKVPALSYMLDIISSSLIIHGTKVML